MAIYKRYNTRKKKLSSKIVVPIVCIAIVFLLTVLLTFLACMLLGQPRKQRRRSAIKAKG